MLGTVASSVGGAGLGGLLGQAGDLLSAPRRGLWSALGLPEQGSELIGNMTGMDSQSALAQALGFGAEMAGDPLSYLGLLGGAGGRLGSKALLGSRAAPALEEAAQAAKLEPFHSRMASSFAPMESVGSLEQTVGTPQYFAAVQKQIEAEAAAQAAGEVAAKAHGAGLPAMDAGIPLARVPLDPVQRSMQEYQGTLAAMHDQMSDMLGKGFATPDEHILSTRMGTDLLEQIGSPREPLSRGRFNPPTGMGGDLAALGELDQAETGTLLMRKHLAEIEGMLPELRNLREDSSLLKQLAGPAADQLAGSGAGGPTIDSLLRRELTSAADAANRGGEVAPEAIDSIIQAQQNLTGKIANAHMASPELRQARKLTQMGEDLLLGRTPPEAVPEMIAELQRFGIPVDPRMVQRTHNMGSPSNISNGLMDLLSSAQTLEPGVDPTHYEWLRQHGANSLLKTLGPQRFQQWVPQVTEQLAGLPSPRQRLGVGEWNAKTAGPAIGDALIEALRNAGMPHLGG